MFQNIDPMESPNLPRKHLFKKKTGGWNSVSRQTFIDFPIFPTWIFAFLAFLSGIYQLQKLPEIALENFAHCFLRFKTSKNKRQFLTRIWFKLKLLRTNMEWKVCIGRLKRQKESFGTKLLPNIFSQRCWKQKTSFATAVIHGTGMSWYWMKN